MDNLNLEQLIELFDIALTSDNPAVQNALKSLLMVATLVHAENKAAALKDGPFKTLFEQVNWLTSEVHRLRNEHHSIPQPWTTTPNTQPWYPSTNPTPPTWTPIWTTSTGDSIPPPYSVTCSANSMYTAAGTSDTITVTLPEDFKYTIK